MRRRRRDATPWAARSRARRRRAGAASARTARPCPARTRPAIFCMRLKQQVLDKAGERGGYGSDTKYSLLTRQAKKGRTRAGGQRLGRWAAGAGRARRGLRARDRHAARTRPPDVALGLAADDRTGAVGGPGAGGARVSFGLLGVRHEMAPAAWTCTSWPTTARQRGGGQAAGPSAPPEPSAPRTTARRATARRTTARRTRHLGTRAPARGATPRVGRRRPPREGRGLSSRLATTTDSPLLSDVRFERRSHSHQGAWVS